MTTHDYREQLSAVSPEKQARISHFRIGSGDPVCGSGEDISKGT